MQRDSPSTSSSRLLRMCVCLCGGGREPKRVLAAENDAMLAVVATGELREAPNDEQEFEPRVEQHELVRTHALPACRSAYKHTNCSLVREC